MIRKNCTLESLREASDRAASSRRRTESKAPRFHPGRSPTSEPPAGPRRSGGPPAGNGRCPGSDRADGRARPGSIGSTLARHRRLRLGVALRFLVELLLASWTAEVVGLALVFTLPGCLLRLDVHPTNRILGHRGFPPSRG